MNFIYPYKRGSRSVRRLTDSIAGRIIKLRNSRYRPRDSHTIINWGNSTTPSWWGQGDATYLNSPECVAIAADKLLTFRALADNDVRVVPFTTDPEEAQDWLGAGDKVFARITLNGHSGDGIDIINTPQDNEILDRIAGELESIGQDYLSQLVMDEIRTPYVPDAPLFTKGITNEGEYRVHVFNNEVILYQKKSRRVDEDGNVVTAEGEAADVRNLASNWVYRTGNLRRLERVEDLAKAAITALGLDFGAVDIIMGSGGDVYVLEVNTAPGLGNTQTLEAYVNAIS